MNTVEIGRLDVGHDMRTLQDDELDAVSGGWSWGMSSNWHHVPIDHRIRR